MLSLFRRSFAVILLAFAVGFAPTVQADGKSELHTAYTKFAALKTWRATITDVKKGQVISTVEYQAPDRWRMKTAGGPESVVIAGMMHMTMDGRTFKMPIGKMLDQFKSHETVQANIDSITVTSASDDVLDGQPVRKIAYVQAKPQKAEAIAWISKKSGLLLRLDVPHKKHPTQMNYSAHNDASIKIVAP